MDFLKKLEQLNLINDTPIQNNNEINNFISAINSSEKRKILIFASYDMPVDPFRQYIPYLKSDFDFFIVYSNAVQLTTETSFTKSHISIKSNYRSLITILERSHYDLVLIGNINNFWHWRFSLIKQFSKSPIICYERDLNTKYQVRDRDEFAYNFNLDNGMVDFIFDCADDLFENSDGIICHYSEEAASKLKKINPKIITHIPVKQKIVNKTEVADIPKKLLYGGTLSLNRDNKPFNTFGDLRAIFDTLSRTAPIDVYARETDDISEIKKGYQNINNLNFRKPLHPDNFIKHISDKYIAGLSLMNFSDIKKTSNISCKHIMITKIFTYLSAGIPVIISKEYEYASNFITENQLGIAYSNDEIKEGSFYIDENMLRDLAENVRSYDFDSILLKQAETIKRIYLETISQNRY